MIEITNTEIYGWQAAVRGMRNPLQSWEKSDSISRSNGVAIGDNDLDLMKKLVKAGSDHSKFMRYIVVTCDIKAPRYFWAEADTYKVGTVANSESTMHTIHKKEFTINDFSCEHLIDLDVFETSDISVPDYEEFKKYSPKNILSDWIIPSLNACREKYLVTKNKEYWYNIIQLLPQSYNQLRTVQLNYAVLRNMYHARKNHKLNEWHVLCEKIESLPYSELITED